MTSREPILEPVPVADLRPTQITVGLREVAEKRREWRERAERDGPAFLGRHMIPVIRGLKGRPYVLDHHHLARALHDEGVAEVAVNVLADLSHLAKAEFWSFCDNRGWCHPYDAEGKRRDFDAIPKAVADLADDPFRSLAGELRRAGGFSKETTPFSEFIWADFLRRRIKRKAVDDDFAAALARALSLSKRPEAQHLPGWCGPSATG
ncbi:MAG: chromosome partitioning protein ParB [Phenylobacterium sp.]|nr:MAG: chromosome partitioning protein ParB [Phenylobacterium sp.]